MRVQGGARVSQQLAFGSKPNTARFSECGTYRYELTRELGGVLTLVSIGLNPSVATADDPDRTINKDIGFARRWQMGRVLKLNAYAYVAQDPGDMKRAAAAGIDVIGPDNNRTIVEAVRFVKAHGGIVVVSWGQNIDPNRQHDMAALLSDIEVWCFGTNLDGSPVHELYQPYTRELKRWEHPA